MLKIRIIVKILKYCINWNDRYHDYPRPIYYRNNIKFYAKTRVLYFTIPWQPISQFTMMTDWVERGTECGIHVPQRRVADTSCRVLLINNKTRWRLRKVILCNILYDVRTVRDESIIRQKIKNRGRIPTWFIRAPIDRSSPGESIKKMTRYNII